MRNVEIRARRARLVAQIASGSRWGYPGRVAAARAAMQALAVEEAIAAVVLPLNPEDACRLRRAVAALPEETEQPS